MQFTRIGFATPLFLLLFTFLSHSNAQSKVKQSQVVESTILAREIKYSVYLPPAYAKSSSAQFKIMYLLHGFDGNENSWIRRCNLQFLMDSLISVHTGIEYIIIMPDADNSYYINDYQGNNKYEDFFIEEFMPHVHEKYKTDSLHLPVICGLSMGGYGATILPVKHPERFSASINLSGSVRTSKIFARINQAKYNNYFGEIYGQNLVGIGRITEHWKQNSPYFLIDSTLAKKLKSINWYIDCGMQDDLFSSNKALHELLLSFEIPHEYHMRIGGHEWSYWRQGLINALLYLSQLN